MNPCLSPGNVLLAAAFSRVADMICEPDTCIIGGSTGNHHNHSPACLPCLPVMRLSRRVECGSHAAATCRAHDPARITPFTMPITAMLSVLVAIMSMHERFDITPLLSFSHSQEKLL
jgi:hypothetical protein